MKLFRKLFAFVLGFLIATTVFIALPLSVASLLISNRTKLKSFVNEVEIYDIVEGALQNTAYEHFMTESDNISDKVTDEFIKSVVTKDSIKGEVDNFVDAFYDWKVKPDADFVYRIDVSDNALWTADDEAKPEEVTVLEIEANSKTANAITRFYKSVNLIPYISMAIVLITLVLYVLVYPGSKMISAISGTVCAVLGAGVSILLWVGLKNGAQALSERFVDQYADYISENIVSDYISMDPINMISTLVEKSAVWFSTESISLTLFVLSVLGGILMIFVIITIIKKVISAPISSTSQDRRKKIATETVVEPVSSSDENLVTNGKEIRSVEKKVILEGKIDLQDEEETDEDIKETRSETNPRVNSDIPSGSNS